MKFRLIVLLVVLALILTSCAAPAPTPTTASEPTSAPAATSEPQPTDEPTAAPTTAPTTSEELTFAMVTDQNGLGDGGFNDAAWAGLQMAEQEFGAMPKVVESREQAQYVPNLTSLAEQDTDLVAAIGFLLTDAVAEVAPQFPDVNFALVDSVVEAPNVACLLFKEEDGSFLVGAIAGLMTKSNTVGFVGGIDSPLIKKFEVGYRAGVMTTNPDAKVLASYVGSFADPAKGEEFANAQYDQGADIVYQAAGQTGLGVINAAKKRNLYAIGVDQDQNPLAPDNVITSMIKRVDTAIFEACKMVANDTFQGGTYTYGIAEGGIGIAPSSENTLPADVLQIARQLEEMVKSGEITVPTTEEELTSFTPPTLPE